MRFHALLTGLLLTAAIPLAGDPALKLRVSPEMCTEPAIIRVYATIEPDDGNRAFEVTAESDDYFRSSRIELDGARAARTNFFQYHDLPAGEYVMKGVLFGADGRERAVVRQSFLVLGQLTD